MTTPGKLITILVADDDPDDRMLIDEVFEENRLANDVRFVDDGEELLEYLQHTGKYEGGAEAPRPGLILLDLNMPRMDCREALKRIKADPSLAQIPVVVSDNLKAGRRHSSHIWPWRELFHYQASHVRRLAARRPGCHLLLDRDCAATVPVR
jgi:CheY-like chemotaxis protein